MHFMPNCKYSKCHGMKIFASPQTALGGTKDNMQQVNTPHLHHPSLQTLLTYKLLARCQTRNKFPLLFPIFRMKTLWFLFGWFFYLPDRIFTLAGVNQIAPAAAAMTVLVGTALLLHGCAGFPWELSHWKPLRCTRRGGLRETLIKVPFTDALHQFISKCYIAN